jgi:prevent-host-death family protein
LAEAKRRFRRPPDRVPDNIGAGERSSGLSYSPDDNWPYFFLRNKYDHGIITIVVKEFGMKKMAAGAFKTNCLAVMDEVQAKRETVVITKHGKPVAKLVPVEAQGDDIFGFLRGKVTIKGDVVSPALSRREWGNLK